MFKLVAFSVCLLGVTLGCAHLATLHADFQSPSRVLVAMVLLVVAAALVFILDWINSDVCDVIASIAAVLGYHYDLPAGSSLHAIVMVLAVGILSISVIGHYMEREFVPT